MVRLGSCPDCGLNMDLVGLRHRCIPAVVNNTIAADIKPAVINTNASRQAKWRKANTELNRQRARDAMRKKRAKSTT